MVPVSRIAIAYIWPRGICFESVSTRQRNDKINSQRWFQLGCPYFMINLKFEFSVRLLRTTIFQNLDILVLVVNLSVIITNDCMRRTQTSVLILFIGTVTIFRFYFLHYRNKWSSIDKQYSLLVIGYGTVPKLWAVFWVIMLVQRKLFSETFPYYGNLQQLSKVIR